MRRRLGIKQRRTRWGITLRITGSLVTGRRGERLLRTVRRILRRGVRAVTLDLSEVRLLDCGGIGLLVRCRSVAACEGASLRLVGARGPVYEMLRMSALCSPPLPI